ncbi:MAG: PAS domain S-box protein [Caldilineaceae bacterium]|nr:PAS domain S-box protein [Caldilineaceae bacterium]HRJ42133.1 PAS domain S-box protein [Caldilineaceae bacterium]
MRIERSDTVLALLESAPIAVVVVDMHGAITLINAKTEELFGYTRNELIGEPLERLLPQRFSDVHHFHRDHYFIKPHPRAMGIGMDLSALRQDGTEFPVEVGLSYVEVDGQRLAMSFITDITVRVEAAESLRSHAQELESRVASRTQEIERRRRVAEGLHDVLTVLNTARPLEEILDLIVEQASQLLATDAIAIFRQDEDDPIPRIQAARYLDTGGIATILPGREELQAFGSLVEDAGIDRTDDDAGMTQAGRYRSVLAVPLNVKGEIYGSICLYYRAARTFTREEKELAIAFADQAALAIENARLREQVSRSAVAAERTRLARDLHDAVTQTLFSTSLIAEVLPKIWERNPQEGIKRAGELRELTRGALAEMRALLLELRPTALIEAVLGDLLHQLADAVTGRARIPVSVTLEGEGKLPSDAQIAFYRIAQESLNNIAKHSGASQALVKLYQDTERVVLEVEDNGRGFDPANIPSTHLGLTIMQERAATIGAHLEIDTVKGEHTRIRAIWNRTAEPQRHADPKRT